DINPSINLGVSASGRVVEAQALDAAAVRILAQIPHLSGASVNAAVADVARAARADGYLQPERGQASFVVLAGAPVTGAERAFTAQQVRAAAGALEILVRPFGSTVVTLPLGRPADVREAASYHLSLGRYLLGKLTRESWSRVGEASLRQILSHWPLKHARVPSSASSGSPSAPPGSGAGGASSSSPGNAGSRTPSSPSQTGSPTIAGTVVTGVLTGVGPDSVVVNGTSYPVSQNAVLVVNRVEVPLSLAIVILLQGQTVSLTIEEGAVVRLTATLALTRQNPLPIFPPATAPPPSSLAS
ncbi:MAG: anti-sigma-I factor RsgI family protein, partial [Clostridia bacterium]